MIFNPENWVKKHTNLTNKNKPTASQSKYEPKPGKPGSQMPPLLWRLIVV
jgi:hypothetical protein